MIIALENIILFDNWHHIYSILITIASTNAIMNMTNNLTEVKFGDHLVFDAYGCPFEILNNRETCLEILENIVKLANMHKLIEPYIIEATSNEVLGGKDPGGFSGFVLIQESHVSVHTFAKRGFVTLDVYSCKDFETNEIVKYLITAFQPKDYNILNFERGMKYPIDNIY